MCVPRLRGSRGLPAPVEERSLSLEGVWAPLEKTSPPLGSVSAPPRRTSSPVGRARFFVASAFLLLLAAGCGGGDAPAMEDSSPGEAAQAPPEPQAPEPQTVADIFPEGEGRILVLNTCSSCHAAACAAIGQRTAPRWEALQESHREHIPSMSEENLETVFSYLQSNFDDSQPEPRIPPAFLQQGCTPF